MMAYITAAFSGFDGNFFSSSPMPFIALKISIACSRLKVMSSFRLQQNQSLVPNP